MRKKLERREFSREGGAGEIGVMVVEEGQNLWRGEYYGLRSVYWEGRSVKFQWRSVCIEEWLFCRLWSSGCGSYGRWCDWDRRQRIWLAEVVDVKRKKLRKFKVYFVKKKNEIRLFWVSILILREEIRDNNLFKCKFLQWYL